MADCVFRTLCEHNHMFTDKNCNGCEHKETHWQYIWATRKKGWKAMDNRCVCRFTRKQDRRSLTDSLRIGLLRSSW